jgi:D-arabinan exo alpha-(1,3)/(1,5)-arabinofuranosidase (non-reducing end)
MTFSGVGVGLHNISLISSAKTRSISAENPTGEKGRGGMSTDGPAARAARDLGQGWKVAPYTHVPAGSTITMAEITGPGEIQHIWLTIDAAWWRRLILRVYWDGEDTPSIETPIGDFFCNGWCEPTLVNSQPISVNPLCGFNSYWPMPFRGAAKITVENLSDEDSSSLYYQVDYALAEVSEDAAYLHAQWRRNNPLPYKEDHVLLDGVQGQGHFVGTYIAWQSNNTGWWGEGEVKFYLDGDEEFPTICGTGTEDYFGGAWDFEYPRGQYRQYSTPFLGLPQVISAGEGGLYRSQQRFGMYRWHIQDPVRFAEDLKVTIQALGWRSGGRYLPLQDDIASTAFWYQREPHAAFPQMPGIDSLEVI